MYIPGVRKRSQIHYLFSASAIYIGTEGSTVYISSSHFGPMDPHPWLNSTTPRKVEVFVNFFVCIRFVRFMHGLLWAKRNTLPRIKRKMRMWTAIEVKTVKIYTQINYIMFLFSFQLLYSIRPLVSVLLNPKGN